MMNLTDNQTSFILSRQMKLFDLRQNSLLRMRSMYVLIASVIVLLLVNAFASFAPVTYQALMALLLGCGILDSLVTEHCRQNPARYAHNYDIYTSVLVVVLLLLACLVGAVERASSLSQNIFITVTAIVSISIRRKPQFMLPALFVCFIVNCLLCVCFHHIDVYNITASFCCVLIEAAISLTRHRSSIAAIEAEHTAQLKSRQLFDANQKLQSYNIKLSRTLRTDSLTGLRNRQSFWDDVVSRMESRASFTVAMIDLDHMKHVNDTYGYAEGDSYIRTAAAILQKNCTADEEVFRSGGDEFMLFSPSASEKELWQRLIGVSSRFSELGGKYKCGFSIGVLEWKPSMSEYPSDLLTACESAMYRNKMERSAQWEYTGSTSSQIDKTGLDSRVFEALSQTDHRSYLFLNNMQTNISRWSTNTLDEFDLPGEYVYDLPKYWVPLIHPDDQAAYTAELEQVFSGQKKKHAMQYRIRNKAGHYVMVTCEGYLLPGRGGEPAIFSGTVVNHGIIDNVDPVTNLHNTYELMVHLRRIKEKSGAAGVLCVAINQFSTVNNTYSYAVGNTVLERFAAAISAAVEPLGGAVYRMDGVKFCVVLETDDGKQLRTLTDQIRGIARSGISVKGTNISFLISAAALLFSRMTFNETAVLSELSWAISGSKQERSGELVLLDDKLHSSARLRLERLNELKRAVLADCTGFSLHYQPQVDMQGRIIGAEALLRYTDVAGRNVPPIEFIPVLENDSCFYELGLWILRTAMKEIRPLIAEYPGFKISINVSYRQLDHRAFRDDVLSIMSETGMPAENLVLELTEHCATLDHMALKNDLQFFRDHGIAVAADDFGTGYSSLANLRDFPFSTVKIDRSFVINIETNQRDRTLVAAIISCAKQFGISTCVEGIETWEMVDCLKEFDPEYFQGYLFSKPIPVSELWRFMDEGPKKRPLVNAN